MIRFLIVAGVVVLATTIGIATEAPHKGVPYGPRKGVPNARATEAPHKGVPYARAIEQEKSVKAGVYTAAQAGRGEAQFKTSCASCHAPNRFTDDLFYMSFAGKPLWEMYDVISDTMPEDNPGSLKPQDYADVISYLLKLNKFPEGQEELPPTKEVLMTIKMEKP